MARTDSHPVYLAAGLVSLLLSLLALWQNGLINHDGVLYLRAIDGDPGAVRWIGNWLFYPKLIGGVADLTGLEAETSAWLLNALLDLLLVLGFLRLIEELGGNRGTLAWAALLVLVLPYLNDNRAEIIRDHGYWAFTLVALVHYLRLYRKFSWKALLLWNLAMGMATLFRVEGLVFMALMPLGLLLRPLPAGQRIRETLKALIPVLAGTALLFFWMLLDGGTGNRLTRLLASSHQLQDLLATRIPEKARQLRETLLPDLSKTTSLLVISFSVLLAIAKDLAESLSWPVTLIILLRRWFPAPALPKSYRRLLVSYASISLLVLFIHGSRHFVMVSRYTMALALVLLPVAVFSLEEFWRRHRRNEAPAWLAGLVVLALAGLAGDSLVNTSRPKPYITDAARWAAGNLPPGSRVVTDYETMRLYYYTEKKGGRDLEFVRFQPGKGTLRHFDYAFIRRPDSPLARQLGKNARRLWQSGKGKNGVTIYRLPPRKKNR
jgi:hypothetical protein